MTLSLVSLFKESSIPSFSIIFGTRSSIRRYLWIIILVTFLALTANSLFNFVREFLTFPIIVNVLMTDSRVLPFPAVTICNLNAVHRSRFCEKRDDLPKPAGVEKVLCANIDTMLELCEISKFLNDLLEEGQNICQSTRSPRPSRTDRTRSKRQLTIRDVIKGMRLFMSGDLIGLVNATGLLTGLGEEGSFLDVAIVQLSKAAGLHLNSSNDLIPALFMRGFSDLTGCKFGSNQNTQKSNGSIALENALRNITTMLLNSNQKLMSGLASCTGPWIKSVLAEDDKSNSTADGNQSTWYLLTDLLQSWLSNLARNNLQAAKGIGHQAEHLITKCYYAGKKCDLRGDFVHFFSGSYGNCFSFNLAQLNSTIGERLAGFTGAKFGLQLNLNLEADQYMPTSRETGAKIVIHDRQQKADPDQDAIHVPPGVVTYIGIQMINITRLREPYRDRCSDQWPTADYQQWADSLENNEYTSQFCLKLCLQKQIINECECWSITGPWPIVTAKIQQCNSRKFAEHSDCIERIRVKYYDGTINCPCPPRCHERIYEKFISTGRETTQCSALTDPNEAADNENPQNRAKVIIYYQSLSYTEIKQDVKYTWSGIIGAIGGILGVYLGFSFMAICEIIETFFRVLMEIFCFKYNSMNTKIKQSS